MTFDFNFIFGVIDSVQNSVQKFVSPAFISNHKHKIEEIFF